MATDLTINVDVSKSKASSDCTYAQQCLWYEAPAPASVACINRNSLVCQKYCEEVFGHGEKQKSVAG
ncbi:MAG: hypothetical protein LBF58_10720 [Deltaproteobacteria bacterium]|nr:hypothetical protein [Deltaproteobacteria bacterium]